MKKALVAGALGVSGRALVNHLVSLQDWEVVGLSRRSPEFQSPAHYIAIDLLNQTDVDACVSNLGDLTHIFYAALQPGSNFFDEIPPNLAMLQHIVEAVERTSARSVRSSSSRGRSTTARTSVHTKLLPEKTTLGRCRPTSTTTKRTT
jgi:nucleoside-diphosphate-sugar epimerase